MPDECKSTELLYIFFWLFPHTWLYPWRDLWKLKKWMNLWLQHYVHRHERRCSRVVDFPPGLIVFRFLPPFTCDFRSCLQLISLSLLQIAFVPHLKFSCASFKVIFVPYKWFSLRSSHQKCSCASFKVILHSLQVIFVPVSKWYVFAITNCSMAANIQQIVSEYEERVRRLPHVPALSHGHLVHQMATYRRKNTRCRINTIWPPDDEHNSGRNM
jgi:hypothetical protein